MKRLAVLLLLASPLMAQEPVHHRWPVRMLQQVKRTFYSDVKAHPVSWGLNMGLQFGIAFSDAATSCRGYAAGMPEVGPARFFIGSQPNCHKAVLLTATAMSIHVTAENWLANAFKDSCDREASKPDSRWWKTPSHTKSTGACYWAVPLADTVALGATEIPTIRNNINWLEERNR